MTRHVLTRNLLANYVYFGVMALVTLFIVPLYAQAMAPLAWGQLAVCLTALNLLLFLDLGLTPILMRDVAAAAATGGAWRVYRHYLRTYSWLAAVCFLLGQALVTVLESGIAGRPPLPHELAWALRLMLVQFVFQLANAATIGYWNGLQQQLRANLRLAAFAMLKHAGALTAVVLVSPSAVAYMSSFALLAALEFAINTRAVRREPRQLTPATVEPRVANWYGMAGFSLAMVLGLMTIQIDRLYLSWALSTEEFGRYFLLGYLALAALHFQLPLQRVFLPRLATAREHKPELVAMLRITGVLIVLPCLLTALFPERVLRMWLHDEAVAQAGADTLRLIFVAVALMAMSAGPKLLLICSNRYRQLVGIEAVVLVAQGLVLWLCAPEWGMLAGGLAWLACGLTQAGVGILLWRRERSPRPVNAEM